MSKKKLDPRPSKKLGSRPQRCSGDFITAERLIYVSEVRTDKRNQAIKLYEGREEEE